MAEIRRKDIWEDQLIQAPLEYSKNLETAVKATDKLIGQMKKANADIKGATTVGKVARETKNLSVAQKELQTIQRQVATANARQTTEYQKQNRELIALREQNRQRNQQLKNEILLSRSVGGEYQKLTVRLEQARKKYKDLAASGRASNKELKRQQTIVTNLNKKVTTIDKSVGQFQRNVGNYPRTFKAAAAGVAKFAAAFGLVGGLFLFARVLRGVVDLTKEYERQNSTLQAVLGVTAKETKQLRQDQLALGASTEFTSKQVAELQTEFARLGFPIDDIRNMTATTLDAALAMGSSLGEQAKLTGATLKAFGLESTEAQKVNDVLAKSTSASALSFEKLNASMSTIAPVANKFGFSLEATTALLGELSNAGFDASTAATATRKILLNLADANGQLAKRLKEPVKDLPSLVRGLKQLKSEGVKLGEALELTDVRSVSAFATFLEGADSVLALNAKLEDASGTAKEMAIVMGDNLQGDMLKLTSAWEGFVLALTKGDTLFTKFLRSITQGITAILNFITPQKTLVGLLEDESVELEVLITQIKNAADNQEERNRLIKELQDVYPSFLKNLDAEKVTNDQLQERMKEVNDQFERKIALTALEQETAAAQSKAVELLLKERELRKELAELEQAGLDTRKDINLLGEETTLGAKKEEQINEVMAERKAILEELKQLQIDLTAGLKEFSETNNDFFEEANEEQVKITQKTNSSILSASDDLVAKIGLDMKALKKAYASTFSDQEQLAIFASDTIKRVDADRTDEMKKKLDEYLAHFEETFNKVQSIYQSASQSLIGISNGITERSIQNIERELQEIDDSTSRQIELAGDNDAAKERIEDQAEARRIALEAQIKREKREQARLEKAAAIIQTVINTAESITKTLATLGIPAGIPASVFAGVLGTAQTATIAAQPIPQFAKGTDSAPGGLAIVGEQGKEIVKELSGKTYLTPDKSTLMDIPKGSEITPHNETMKALAFSALGQEVYTTRQQNELLQEVKELKATIEDGDNRLVKAIVNNGGRLEADGSILMKVREDEAGNRTRTRKKSMG